MDKNHVQVLQSALLRGSELLGGFSDRVPYDSILKQHAATLPWALVAAKETIRMLYDQMSYRGRPQARCRFFSAPVPILICTTLPLPISSMGNGC